MKGCAQFGCAAVIGVIILIFIIAGFGANSQHSNSTATTFNNADFAPAPKSKKHGWVVQAKMGTNVDFWDGTTNYCDAIKAAAQEIYDAQQQGRDVDTSVTSQAAGRHDLHTGTRIEIIGHDSSECSGQSMSWTHVRVIDKDSGLNGETGYVMEGSLSKQ